MTSRRRLNRILERMRARQFVPGDNENEMDYSISQATHSVSSSYIEVWNREQIAAGHTIYSWAGWRTRVVLPFEGDHGGKALFRFGTEKRFTGLILDGGNIIDISENPTAQSVNVTVHNNVSIEEARRVTNEYLARYVTAETPAGSIDVSFWSESRNGGTQIVRRLDVPPGFQFIADNYTQEVAGAVTDISALNFAERDDNPSGHLILLHGPSGTGKTTIIRALGGEWRKWADLHYITDPERFFGEGRYMLSVLLGETISENDWEEDDAPPAVSAARWRIIVVEDAGELLGVDAKQQSGQALARLFNVCDGLIGQGLRICVVITTNEDLDRIHSAIRRSGRCLANIHVPGLTAEQADVWRTLRNLPAKEERATIAELYEELRASKGVKQFLTKEPQRRIGYMK